MKSRFHNRYLEKDIEIYCKTVRKHLICSVKIRNKLITELKYNIYDYLIDHPDATIADIEEHFGTPEDISVSYLSTLDTSELSRRVSKIRRLKIIAIVIAATILLFILIISIIEVRGYLVTYNRHFETTITYSDSVSPIDSLINKFN